MGDVDHSTASSAVSLMPREAKADRRCEKRWISGLALKLSRCSHRLGILFSGKLTVNASRSR
jgi:hypothetical protein